MNDSREPFHAGDAAAEQVEVVDEQGVVVEVTTRARVRAEQLRHRCTYVAVLTGDDELVVHRRAGWKDVYPGYWDVCFGGVCGVGESWRASAERELAEEAGLVAVALDDLGPVRYDQPDGRIVGRVYLARSDATLDCVDGEVVAVDRVPVAALDEWLASHDVCPDSSQVALPLVRARITGPAGAQF